MKQNKEEIESFRYVKAARRLMKPITNKLEKLARNEDVSDELRFEALISLGKIGDTESLPTLMQLFNEYPECLEPITALGFYKSSTPVSKLIERLQDPDSLFKEEIVRVLGEIGDPMATKILIELLHDEDRMVRYYSARALYKMGGRDVVQSLCSLLNDPDEWIVINVLDILSKMKDPEAIPALVGQFEVTRDSRLKAIIISSLSTFAEGKLLKTFESGLDSFDPRIQANSVEAISMLKIPDNEIKRKLKRFYGHPNNRVRANMCIALSKADPKSVFEEIGNMLVSQDASTRRSAAYVLARIDCEKRNEYIHTLLEDENFGVRKMALKAAMMLEGSVGVEEIKPLLDDENQWVRREVIECAIKLNDFPNDLIIKKFKNEDCPPVLEVMLKYIIDRGLNETVPMIYERIKKEPDEEMPWLIATLGHLGAVKELNQVKKFLGAVRASVFVEYYEALLLNGDLNVFNIISDSLEEKKREHELVSWANIAGCIGSFIQDTKGYSKVLLEALGKEVKTDLGKINPEINNVQNESIDSLMEEARKTYLVKDYLRTSQNCEKIIALRPHNIEARYLLACSVYYLGDANRASDLLEKILISKPSHIDAGILLGQIYFRRKDWKSLADCYNKLKDFIQSDDKKNIIRIYGALGLAYYNLKKYQEAIQSLNTGLKANPRDLSSSYHLALCYYSVGDTDRSRQVLESLRKTLPPDSQVLKNVLELLQRI